MPRRRKKRPNWHYRLAWCSIWLTLMLYVGLQTVYAAFTFGRRSYGIDWGLAFVSSCFDATIAIFFFVVGGCIGSFLNVVAYRLPLGRFIGGHSACPYCCTPIEGVDNVPVLAWIKLRGRCRTCRLPISIQYPLVELAAAIIFLFVYVSEVASGGANLPSHGLLRTGSGGVLRVSVTPAMILQLFAYLFALSSLVAAALIAVKRRRVPMGLYVWALLPLLACSLVMPKITIVPWRSAPAIGPIEARLDVVVTLLCGAVAGMAIARLLAPLGYPGFDRSLMGADTKTVGARQFVGGLAVAGAVVGWQSSVATAWCVVVMGLLAVIVLRSLLGDRLRAAMAHNLIDLGDLTVWIWLGLLTFRACWLTFFTLMPELGSAPQVLSYVIGAILLAPLIVYFHRLASPRTY